MKRSAEKIHAGGTPAVQTPAVQTPAVQEPAGRRRYGLRVLAWSAAAVVLAGVVFLGVRGCALAPWNKKASAGAAVPVSVTTGFGGTMVASGKVSPTPATTVMDALEAVAKVETEYGGAFVTKINGIGSTSGAEGRADWFYYVNGVLAGAGATDFELRGGDAVWWDLHAWNQGSLVPAVVGAYPRPFTSGYSREPAASTIVFGGGTESLAREIGSYLQSKGATLEFAPAGSDPGSAKGPGMAVLMADEAAGMPWVAKALSKPGKDGAFVALDSGKIVPLDKDGRHAPAEEDVVAAVVATGSGMGDASPLWLVLCAGEPGLDAAREVMVSNPGSLRLAAGLAVDASGQTHELPR